MRIIEVYYKKVFIDVIEVENIDNISEILRKKDYHTDDYTIIIKSKKDSVDFYISRMKDVCMSSQFNSDDIYILKDLILELKLYCDSNDIDFNSVVEEKLSYKKEKRR